MALQSINTAQNKNASQTLQKLSALFQLNSEDWLEVDFSGWGNNAFDKEKFELLKTAVIQRRTVKIQYANSYEEIGERIVEPLKLVYKSRAWYLKAFCTLKQDWRIFKLNRILDLTLLNDRFVYREFPYSTEIFETNFPEIMLHFPKEMAYRVYDEFDRTQVQQQADGSFLVSAKMPVDAWLIGFLLSFGTQVDILAPLSLRDAVAKQAEQIFQKMQKTCKT